MILEYQINISKKGMGCDVRKLSVFNLRKDWITHLNFEWSPNIQGEMTSWKMMESLMKRSHSSTIIES